MIREYKYPIFSVVLRRWKINLPVFVLVSLGILYLVFFIIDKRYTADVSILPSAASMASGFGGTVSSLMGMTGMDVSSSSVQSQEMYEGILTSRQLLKEVLYDSVNVDNGSSKRKMRLIDYLDIEGESENEIFGKALKEMREQVIHISINAENNVLTLSVTLKDPALSAIIANKMTGVLDVIIQNQVQKEFHEQYNYLASRLVEIQKDVKITESQLEEFLRKISTFVEPHDQIIELRLRRDLEIQSAVITELTKQREMFIVQNMINLSPVKILDPAIPPYKKSRPKRLLMTISLGFLWLCLQVGINAIALMGKNIISDLSLKNSYK